MGFKVKDCSHVAIATTISYHNKWVPSDVNVDGVIAIATINPMLQLVVINKSQLFSSIKISI